MKKYLYVNSTGWEVRTHSFSGGEDFRFCPEKYRLKRLSGWNERELSAARLFGLDLEAGIRFFHEHNQDTAKTVEYFQNRWDNAKELAVATEFSDETKQYLKDGGFKNFKPGYGVRYTKVEGGWAALRASGTEMLKLYAIRHRSFPVDLSKPKFQLTYRKELFPGTEWAGVEFVAYIDIVAPSNIALGPMGVDCKTSGNDLDETPGMLSLDQQLRTYAWVTGIPDWSFLWFTKAGREIEKGSRVSLLTDAGNLKAGDRAVVALFQQAREAEPADPEKPRSKPKPAIAEELWVFPNDSLSEVMEKECGDGQTKVEKEARYQFIQKHGTLVDKQNVTKQRIQFLTAHIGLAEQQEAAQLVARDVAAIIQANEENWWPKLGSIRGMDKKCLNCQMRGLCLNNNEIRDKLIFRTDDEWDNQED